MSLKRLGYAFLIASLFWGALAQAQNFKDPFQFSWEESERTVGRGGKVVVDILFDIPPGHYLYQDKTELTLEKGDGVSLKKVKYPKAVRKLDVFSGKELAIFEGTALASVILRIDKNAPLGEQDLELGFTYQGCSPKICFRQMKRQIPITLQVVGAVSDAQPSHGLQDRLAQSLQARGWLAYLLAFIGGVLTDFTPCVIPLIPLTLAVIGIRREKKHGRNFALTAVLVLAMAATYALLGLGAALLGFQLGFLFQNPWFLLFGAVLFVVFALGMFGAYELQLPLWLRNRMAKVGGQGYGGAAIAGVTMGLLAAPCVGPVIAALLVWVAQTRDALHGFGLLFSFGLGMGSLILVIGTFYGSLAGRLHGGVASLWVKQLMGVLLLVPAFYYGWIAYKGLQTPVDKPPVHDAVEMTWVHDYDQAIQKAKETKKPILIDFYADWCLPCLEWEQETFSDPEVKALLEEKFVPLKIDCTQNTPTCKAAVDRFKVIGWPTILVTDSRGKELRKARLVGEVLEPHEFIPYLKRFSK